MGRVQSVVEGPHLLVVEPQVCQLSGESGNSGTAVSVSGGVREPSEPGRHVRENRGRNHEDERPPHVRQECASDRCRMAGAPAARDLAQCDEQSKEGEHVNAGPLDGAGETRADSSREKPRAVSRIGADRKGASITQGEVGPGRAPPLPRLAESIPHGQLGDECGLGHVLILHDAQECGQRKHGKKSVEDGCTAHDDRHAVRRQEQACEECDGGGSEQVLSESAQKEYGDDAADGRRDAPSHGVGLAEELHAHRDQPLARRRMNGIAAHRGQAGGVAVGERRVDVFRPRSLVPEGEE